MVNSVLLESAPKLGFLPLAIAGGTETLSKERVGMRIVAAPSTLRASESPAAAGKNNA